MLNNISPIRNLRRWQEIQAILFRYGFDFLLDNKEVRNIQTILNKRLNISLSLPQSELSKLTLPERVRLMLQELGPTFVKLGQILSSSSDLLPREWIIELSKLQDDVPAFAFEEVQEIIEEDLGPIEELFLDFDPEPVAAASIGQVHKAVLPDFTRVVVKVQRPNIISQVQSDMEFVREIARLIRARTEWGKKYGVIAIVEEMARTLNEEMDYRYEATNADRLRRNMASQRKVHVPFVYWHLITQRVLTMEAIDGIKVTDLNKLNAANIDCDELANVFMRSIFKQLLIDGFFHADPHPANVLVDIKTHKLVYIDTGMMGSLLPEQREQLADIVQAILQRDTLEIMRLAMSLGTPFQPVNEMKMRRDMARLIHQYLEAPLERISFSNLLSQVLTTIFQNGIRLPAELGWAAKTLLQGEEVGRKLDPNIPIIDILKSIAVQVFIKKLDPQDAALSATNSIREIASLLQIMPRSLRNIIKSIEDGTLHVNINIVEIKETINQILIISNRLIAGLILVGMLIGSALAMVVDPTTSWAIIPILGMIGFITAMIIGLILLSNTWAEIRKTQKQTKKEENKRFEN